MCKICNEWKSGKITSQQAMDAIGVEIEKSDKKMVEHLVQLSTKIIDKDVPVQEVDEELESDWWKHTHSEE